MPFGFAIFITSLIVSFIVILIYHNFITPNSSSNDSSTQQGYNYNENIQYINSRLEPFFRTSLDEPYDPPDMPNNQAPYTPYP
jgi:hypothetical protein